MLDRGVHRDDFFKHPSTQADENLTFALFKQKLCLSRLTDAIILRIFKLLLKPKPTQTSLAPLRPLNQHC